MLVSGDTLFLDGCGRTDLPGGDPEALYESLTQKLAIVPDDSEGDAWERKVLSSFLEPGAGPDDPPRIKEVPASERKRLVLLRWLVGKFEPGRRYPEPEVNILLALHHNDHASWRRYLVDTGLMEREGGIYWRREGHWG
jgi:hypothetical protein